MDNKTLQNLEALAAAIERAEAACGRASGKYTTPEYQNLLRADARFDTALRTAFPVLIAAAKSSISKERLEALEELALKGELLRGYEPDFDAALDRCKKAKEIEK